MKKITEVTRQDIFDVIKNGFCVYYDNPISSGFNGEFTTGYEVTMPFYGRITELDFLSRLYKLDDMPSTDYRFNNAYQDIQKHTVYNDDWDYCWFFSDSRFCLSNGNEDEPLLDFLCEMLHPLVRDENKPWREYLNKFNQLLNFDGYELYEAGHISGYTVYGYKEIDSIETDSNIEPVYAKLTPIGEGSYAKVYKYYDVRYDKWFALKRANKNLNEKDLLRFKREYDDMKKLNSLYVLEVFNYDDTKNQYTMELADNSLAEYIRKNKETLEEKQRRKIVLQLLNAYEHIHEKKLLHRDISPKNILVKQYDDSVIIKISDFGLVKETESELTSDSTDIKGCFNDPALRIEGFKNYSILHEVYALTQVIVFVMTGKINFDKLKNERLKSFLSKGTNSDKSKRFQTIDEMRKSFFQTGSC